jgi:probable phosphomutase (TIGR03848 family)
MAYVLLVRHGQNDWVSKNRLAGWTPGVHLNEKGQGQAETVADRLKHLPIAAVYSSPLERCLETAEPIGRKHRLKVLTLEAVGEVRYGRWEGKKLKKLVKKRRKWYAVQHYPSRFRFPSGESFLQVQHRAVAALEELNIRHEKDMIVVVSHADVIKLILAYYQGIHIDLFQRIGVSPASVSIIALSSAGPVQVLRINDHGPVEAPPKARTGKEKKRKGKGKAAR